jgi:deoxyribodipyrimidine photolyase-related protein
MRFRRRGLAGLFLDRRDRDELSGAQSIRETRANAYAHHIQRLMVIGNFCLLAGIDPRAVQEWFLIVYFDAYEWVEMPNVVGMALFADGGFLASKPYAASGSYINKMSDYCGSLPVQGEAEAGRGCLSVQLSLLEFSQ